MAKSPRQSAPPCVERDEKNIQARKLLESGETAVEINDGQSFRHLVVITRMKWTWQELRTDMQYNRLQKKGVEQNLKAATTKSFE